MKRKKFFFFTNHLQFLDTLKLKPIQSDLMIQRNYFENNFDSREYKEPKNGCEFKKD